MAGDWHPAHSLDPLGTADCNYTTLAEIFHQASSSHYGSDGTCKLSLLVLRTPYRMLASSFRVRSADVPFGLWSIVCLIRALATFS